MGAVRLLLGHASRVAGNGARPRLLLHRCWYLHIGGGRGESAVARQLQAVVVTFGEGEVAGAQPTRLGEVEPPTLCRDRIPAYSAARSRTGESVCLSAVINGVCVRYTSRCRVYLCMSSQLTCAMRMTRESEERCVHKSAVR